MTAPNDAYTIQAWTHEERVLRVLQLAGPLRRGDIAKSTRISRSTLSEVITRLFERGAVVVVDTDATDRRGSGRPAQRIALDPAAGQLVGVDFGHAQMHIAIGGASHDIVATASSRYTDDDWAARAAQAVALIDEMAAQAGVHFGAIQGVAIGVPGRTHERYDAIGKRFARRFGIQPVIDNNTRFAALAEAVAQPRDDTGGLVYLRVSDGIGGGLVVGGRLVTGATGTAGELGHVVVDPKGSRCRCGKRGCLETVASLPAILSTCRSRGVDVDSLEALRAAVELSDPVVDGVLREAGLAIGRVLGMATLTINPAQVVVGGELLSFAPMLVQQISTAIRYEVVSIVGTCPTVRVARHGDVGGALGAIEVLYRHSSVLADYRDAAREKQAAGAPIGATA